MFDTALRYGRSRVGLVFAALAVAACSGPPKNAVTDGGGGIEDAPPGPCWSLDGTTPAGKVELGTGATQFEQMPQSLRLTYRGQGAPVLPLNARIQGLDPGDPKNVFDSSNPETLFSAVLPDGTVVKGSCPVKTGYKSDGAYFDLGPGYLSFFPVSLAKQAANKQITVKVEVVDDKHHYASDEKQVLVLPANTADGGIGDGGMDAAAGDAGVDAATTGDGGMDAAAGDAGVDAATTGDAGVDATAVAPSSGP